jgi:hypothetical protein
MPFVHNRVREIKVLKDLQKWTGHEPPAFVNIACIDHGGTDAVAHEAQDLCSQTQARWPQVRPHVGLLEDLPRVALQLLDPKAYDAYDIFLDLTPIHLLPGMHDQLPTSLGYNPAERKRLLNSVDRFLSANPRPRRLRLTGEHVPRQEGEWCFIYDSYTPLVRERLYALREVIEHCRGHAAALRHVETTVFGTDLENIDAFLDRVAVVCYLILPGSTPTLFTREELVRRLERLKDRPRAHEFDDRSVQVLYITQNEGDYAGIPNKRRFRCGSNIAVASLFWHALQK